MLRHFFLVPALFCAALAPSVGWAQAPRVDDHDNAPQDVSRKIRDQLTEQGFKDIKVVPGSYIVSGKDNEGNPIVMMIGPNSMTVLEGTPENGGAAGIGEGSPSIAQSPGNKDIIEE